METTTEQNKGTGIVLNRMYVGEYLSDNIGHEVINLFKADNGRHYLYLNSRGNRSSIVGNSVFLLLYIFLLHI